MRDLETTESTPTRRSVLRAGGALLIAGVAGCSTRATDSGSGPTDSGSGPTDTEHDDGGHHGDDGHDHGSDLDGPVAETTVTVQSREDGHHFSPHVVWVETGGSVTWELKSGTHTATAYAPANDKPRRIPDGADAFDSGVLGEVGETFEHTFQTEGVYDYYCRPHESSGMIGTVVVGKPDPNDQPGLTDPSPELPGDAPAKIRTLNERVTGLLEQAHGDGGHHGEEEGHHDETATEHHDDGHHDETATEHHE
ncbi:MAG: plastocyanin/azurin family copper-binding protein [Haloarculaceae archaeon]